MLEFLARHAIWIAGIVICLALYYEYRQNPEQLKKRAPDIALLIASAFLAVALAFERTNYDRRQQRIQEAQTIVISGAMSLTIALKEVARILENGHDLVYSENWFQVPALLEKMTTDEKVLAAIGRPSVNRIMEGIATMRRSNDRAKYYYPEWLDIPEGTKKEWKPVMSFHEKACNVDIIIGQHLIAASAILKEACEFIQITGEKRPDFLKSLAITTRERKTEDVTLFVRNCKVMPNDQANEFLVRHLQNVKDEIDGKSNTCKPLLIK